MIGQVKVLGSGASGQVMLMELGSTGCCFAVKSVSKQDMVARNKVRGRRLELRPPRSGRALETRHNRQTVCL